MVVLFFRNWDGAAPIRRNYRFVESLERLCCMTKLRRMATHLRDDRAKNTLQTIALVNEVHLRLVDVKNVDWRKLVELRYFGGLTEEEIAEVRKIPPRTARRDWAFAKILANAGTEPVTAVGALLLRIDSVNSRYHHEYAWCLGSEIRMCQRMTCPQPRT